MNAPKLTIMPGTVVSQSANRVTLLFSTVAEADEFCEWLKWLDANKELGVTLEVSALREH